MSNNLLMCLTMTICGAFGGFLFKKAADGSPSILRILFNPYLYLGAVLYIMAAGLNILVLKHLNYTVVMPISAITYIWTLCISYLILKEKISKKKVVGVIFILIGALLISI